MGLLEGSRKFDHPNFNVEARFRRHRLHDLGHGFIFRPFGHHVIDADGQGQVGFLEQRLGFCNIPVPDRKCLLIVGMLRADPLIPDRELTVEYDLVEGIPVDREIPTD